MRPGDITPPVPGLTWDPPVPENDWPGRWVFRCSVPGCGRQQGYAPADRGGGVTEEEAEHLGWRKIDKAWVCPFCNGNTDNLRKVFDG